MRRLAAVLVMCGAACAQQIEFGDASVARRQHVELVTDTVRVAAGRAEWVEIGFRVDPGLHINSHQPKDELLIPTTLQLEPGAVKVVGQEYPAGLPLRLGTDEVLSIYQGEFRVRLRVEAAKGESVLNGALRYQACDDRSCFPPRLLPVRVAVSAR